MLHMKSGVADVQVGPRPHVFGQRVEECDTTDHALATTPMAGGRPGQRVHQLVSRQRSRLTQEAVEAYTWPDGVLRPGRGAEASGPPMESASSTPTR